MLHASDKFGNRLGVGGAAVTARASGASAAEARISTTTSANVPANISAISAQVSVDDRRDGTYVVCFIAHCSGAQSIPNHRASPGRDVPPREVDVHVSLVSSLVSTWQGCTASTCHSTATRCADLRSTCG